MNPQVVRELDTTIFDDKGRARAHHVPMGSHGATVVDPFQLWESGEAVLRSQLQALASWHLRNVAGAYELLPSERLAGLGHAELVDAIVLGVRNAWLEQSVTVGRPTQAENVR